MPCVVDLWGPQCGPCLALMPEVEKLAEAYEGKLKFCKLNVAENRRLVISLRVMAVPTILFYKGGECVARISGDAVSIEAIKAEAGHRLSIPVLREMYPESALGAVDWQRLGYGKYGMLAEEGLRPDLVAEMFGFPSGDAMVRQLLDTEKFRSVVEAVTDQRMLEQYGELSSPEVIAKAADEAVKTVVEAAKPVVEAAKPAVKGKNSRKKHSRK